MAQAPLAGKLTAEERHLDHPDQRMPVLVGDTDHQRVVEAGEEAPLGADDDLHAVGLRLGVVAPVEVGGRDRQLPDPRRSLGDDLNLDRLPQGRHPGAPHLEVERRRTDGELRDHKTPLERA